MENTSRICSPNNPKEKKTFQTVYVKCNTTLNHFLYEVQSISLFQAALSSAVSTKSIMPTRTSGRTTQSI